MALNLIFTSFTEFETSSGIESLFIRSGYKVCFSDIQQNIQDNQDYNKVLVISLQTSPNHIERLKFLLKMKSEKIPCFCIFHCDKGELNPNLLQWCCDFVVWPCPQSELFFRLHRLVTKPAASRGAVKPVNFNNTMVGESTVFNQVLKRIEIFSRCDAPVLIEGETGTGKEMVARSVHYQSNRKDYPFIAVNCGALPDNLIENELFGHQKGAYTDANSNSKGLVGQAHKGTLFLDELESLSAKLQSTLLRLLQEQEYKPLGSSVPIKANIRIVSATNISLKKLTDQGIVRQDLYYRLNILSVILPPLRERNQDIKLLAEFFLSKYQQQYSLTGKSFSNEALDWLIRYPWPGNIRELENLVHRALLLSENDIINPHHLDENIENSVASEENTSQSSDALTDVSFNDAKSQVIRNFEIGYLGRLMQRFEGNVTLAAKKACKERRALGKLLKKHGIARCNYL